MRTPSTIDPSPNPAANLRAIEARLNKSYARVTVLAVSKTQGPEKILPLLEAGHRHFGENRVQEAQGKWPALKSRFPGLSLHLIGPLQTNKVADAVALFDVIETLDRDKLARALAEEMPRQGRRPRLLIQINTGEEPQKAGIAPNEADAFIEKCQRVYDLPVRGLMCIPPADEPPAPHFALLAKIAHRNDLAELSMGMSHDYLIAVSLGSSEVRIGSEIFGARAV